MTKKTGDRRLTSKQALAVHALALGATQEHAATCAGVAPDTVARWLKLPHFRQAVRERQDGLWAETSAQLLATLAEAVDVVAQVMRDNNNPPGVRVRAALGIIDRAAIAYTGVDLAERIDALTQGEK